MSDSAPAPLPVDLSYYQKETLHDMSFSMGYAWAALSQEARSYIMDAIGGSRSLAELAMVWGEEFDTMFSAKLVVDPECETYLEDVDSFFDEKWEVFIAGHVADRITK